MPHSGYVYVQRPRSASPCLCELWPARVIILVILLIVILTSRGVGVCLALALARQLQHLWCVAPPGARRRDGQRKNLSRGAP
jgi:hypothetical protein